MQFYVKSMVCQKKITIVRKTYHVIYFYKIRVWNKTRLLRELQQVLIKVVLRAAILHKKKYLWTYQTYF